MKTRSICSAGLIGLLCAAALACGDDAGSDRFPELSRADNLQYETERLGVGFHHGETMQLDPQRADGGVLGQGREVISHAFLHVGAYDQFATIFGEYHVYRGSDGDVRGASFFDSNRAAARLEPRADDLYNEVSGAMGQGDFEDFDTYSFVVDFWKADGSWYIPWDGNSQRSREDFGFYRTDMRAELLDQLVNIAEAHTPRYMIVGTDMERLLASVDGEPLSEAEFANYVSFFRRAADAIKQVSPQTKVGAGINWERFAHQVAPRYAADAGDAEAEADVSHETLDTAFEATLLPLVEAGDIVALKSYVDPDEAQPHIYQFLRRIGSLYDIDRPVVWYSIGSPASSPAGYNQQRIYVERFAEWNAGVGPEMIAWRTLLNIDGADVEGGSVTGRCRGLTGTNDFGIPPERCFDGLFTSVLQPKVNFDELQDAIE